jgi:hypothetical protein
MTGERRGLTSTVAPLLTGVQVSVGPGGARQVAIGAQMPRQLVSDAHAPLRRHLLGREAHRRAQPRVGQAPWPAERARHLRA